MRDMLRRINHEQEKKNTFQTPAPNPRFGALSQLTPNKFQFGKNSNNQQKVINGGIVMQNLYQHQQLATELS